MAHHSAPAGAPLSRRRILQGVAWATPAVLVGVAAPPAAASTLPPPAPTPDPVVSLSVTQAANTAMDQARFTIVFGQAANSPTGAVIGPGYVVRVTVPVANKASIQALTYDSNVWLAQPSAAPVNSNAATLTLTYKGPALIGPSATAPSVYIHWTNAFNHNASGNSGQVHADWIAKATVMDPEGVTVLTKDIVVPRP